MFREEVWEGFISARPLGERGGSEVPSDEVVHDRVEDVVAEGQVLELQMN